MPQALIDHHAGANYRQLGKKPRQLESRTSPASNSKIGLRDRLHPLFKKVAQRKCSSTSVYLRCPESIPRDILNRVTSSASPTVAR
ncbi:hypothetical protein M413DRAFT_166895 [Hebeloma cylindrosporum]|uniref:Uncharacterized protein n=1 Tax=Hebeloma cylindrosporum TaxID=76867 RepID=A0A0C3BVT1_HEBCY|nr:hypothetical protein M413DRAFT_166895 [Hebeloma cylindrosporum h7]